MLIAMLSLSNNQLYFLKHGYKNNKNSLFKNQIEYLNFYWIDGYIIDYWKFIEMERFLFRNFSPIMVNSATFKDFFCSSEEEKEKKIFVIPIERSYDELYLR